MSTTIKDLALVKDLVQGKDLATVKDLVQGKDLATVKDLVQGKDLTTVKDLATVKDLVIGKDLALGVILGLTRTPGLRALGLLLGLTLVLTGTPDLQAQYVTVHNSHEGIYLFLDELATEQIIDLHSLVKPYSRRYIAEKLMEAEVRRAELGARQRAELDFYLRDFRRDVSTGQQNRVEGDVQPQQDRVESDGRPQQSDGRPQQSDGRPQQDSPKQDAQQVRPQHDRAESDGRPQQSDGRPQHDRAHEEDNGRPQQVGPQQSDGRPQQDVQLPATSWLWQKNHGNKRFDVFHYSDSLFTLTVNPIVGADLWGNSNGTFHHWWNGVEARSTIGRFGIWASFRDNHESTELTARDFQNACIGGSNIKVFSGGKRDYWEMRGGITYAWRWGHTGIIMEQFSWGENNAGSNILSGRTPAFARFELAMYPAHWFTFTWVHASPVSEVVDSTLSFYTTNSYGTDYREVYHPKHLSANIFTFTPVKGLQLSVGNSVVYDYRQVHPAFLLPVAFYKAIDHTLNARINNMNSQLFFSASSRNLRQFHIYGSVFLDEVAVDRIFDPEDFNFVSYKAGVSSTLVPNTRVVFEYTWTNSLTFRHNVPTTTYESNQYNLGHYLEDNARDLYASLEYRPFRATAIRVYFNRSLKGPDHTLLGSPRTGPAIAPFDPIVWKSVRTGMLVTFQVVNDLSVRLGYQWREVSGEDQYLEMWTPDVYQGTTGTWQVGLNYGF